MKFFTKNKKGFTLVETLIAISILLVGVSAAFSAAQSGLSSTSAVKDRITAIFLAQEAMEAIRNLKDSNLLAQNAASPPSNDNPYWLFPLSGLGNTLCSPFAGSCDYDFNPSNNTPNFISCGATCFLNMNDEGFYVHNYGSGLVQSKFRRQIAVQVIAFGNPEKREARVTVTVTWPGNSITVTDNLFNWFAPL